MAPCQEGRREHGPGASPAAVRWRPSPVHRDGAGRFLDGGDSLHARAGNSACRRPELRGGRSLRTDHARKVLAAFGGHSANLPDNHRRNHQGQKDFLKQSVAGLAEEGKVISVRLALFAEMMKGKAWTPASLKAVGGTEGVGVTFLEETFSAATAPPEHRYHQKAARADSERIAARNRQGHQGPMRSYAELLEASGYGSRPRDFRRSHSDSGQ